MIIFKVMRCMSNMDDAFIGAEAVGKVGVSYATALFKYSGYIVADFGLEHQKTVIKDTIKKSYEFEVNCILHTMPDVVVLDKDTKEAMFVEVKYHRSYDIKNFRFKWRRMKNYMDHWPNMILVLIRDSDPYFSAVRVSDVDWHKCYKGVDKDNNDIWDLSLMAKDVRELFPRVTEQSYQKACALVKR